MNETRTCYCIHCIYNEKSVCILEELTFMNEIGMCEDCEFIDVDEKILHGLKQALLNKRKVLHELWDKPD
jgi:hypothetical protein